MRPSDVLQHRLDRLGLRWSEIGHGDDFSWLRERESRGYSDEAIAATLALHLDELEEAARENPFIEPGLVSGLTGGRHRFVQTVGGQEVWISFQAGLPNTITHGIVVGNSGYGKSSLIAQLACEAATECHTLILDSNRFYHTVPRMFARHQFVRCGDLRINLWDGHDGVSVGVSDQLVHHCICDSYSLQFAEYEIAEVVSELRETDLPNLPAVIERLKLKNYRGNTNRGRYRDSAVLVLGNLLSATGELFCCARGMDLHGLLHGNFVLETDGLLPEHQAFLVRFLLTQVHLAVLAR